MRKWLAPALGMVAAGGFIMVAIGLLIQWRELAGAGVAIAMAVFLGCFLAMLAQEILRDWEKHSERRSSSRH